VSLTKCCEQAARNTKLVRHSKEVTWPRLWCVKTENGNTKPVNFWQAHEERTKINAVAAAKLYIDQHHPELTSVVAFKAEECAGCGDVFESAKHLLLTVGVKLRPRRH